MRRKIDSIRLLFPYLTRYRWRFVPGFLSLILNNTIWLAMPLLLKAGIDSLSRGVTREKLLAYALCRQLEGYDEIVVDNVMDAIAKDGYRMQTLITEIVMSYPFTQRRIKN